MEFRENAEGCLIDGSRYSARIYLDRVPWAELRCDSVKVFRMPLVSGLSMVDAEERLQGFTVRWDADPAGDRVECRVHAESSVWSGREFLWVFGPAMIRYRHTAAGRGKLGRCHFFSNGVSGLHDAGTSPGVDHNTWVYAARCFSPRANHGDMFYFPTSLPQSLGITNINAASGVYDPIQMSTGMFCPPPLQLIFGGGTTWVGVGIGEKPGLHLFNNFEYSGARFAGASFYVDYLGYRTIETGFTSPDAAIHFGFSEYDVLRQYVEWLDLSGFSTFNRFAPQPWHERPIFCGWGEQVAQGKMRGMRADDLSRQDNYTDWLSAIDARSLPVGTVVVDDKWQREYGLFRPDGTKWPDMKAFIAGQHARGRHVLLWIPVLHAEGLPPELCIRDGNDILAADITNPAYEELLRQGIRFLVRDMGADGFKEDWIRGFVTKPDVAMHEPMHGIEMLRRYQLIVHDEAHRLSLIHI